MAGKLWEAARVWRNFVKNPKHAQLFIRRPLSVRPGDRKKPGEIVEEPLNFPLFYAGLLPRKIHAAEQLLQARVGTQAVKLRCYFEQ
jgi:hypothetical protein